jgi:DNA mismatch repair protein MutL
MSDIIQLLPDSIANQIAAGEVIQRPASVVKELMENAIDAGASEINVIIKDAGKTLIQIIDNGSGMSETDARLSFERHATSKIRQAADLFSIRTKGFRGEALASIAAIAQVEMITKLGSEDLGNLLVIHGSNVQKQEFCQASNGTKISVKNLFFNVPARRKFLKTDSVELKHLTDEFIRIALAHEKIKFTLHHNDREMYHLPSGKLMQRITGIFGKKFAEKLVPLDQETDIISLLGFVGKPDASRRSRQNQFLFVNRRYIRSNYLNHAIKLAYEDMIPGDEFPVFFVFLEIEPDRIDINIHPTKQEIKFEEERLIYNYLRVSIRQALGKYSITPTLDFDKSDPFKDLLARSSDTESFDPGKSGGYQKPPLKRPEQDEWQQIFEGLKNSDIDKEKAGTNLDARFDLAESIDQESISGNEFNFGTDINRTVFQLHNRFIICQIKSGFLLVDQKNAHERILYEQYLKALSANQHISQQEMFPATLELNPEQTTIMHELIPNLSTLGFQIEHFGQNSFIIKGIPARLKNHSTIDTLLRELIESYSSNIEFQLGINENLARSFAVSSSIKRNKRLSIEEMQQLIDELFACENPYTNPMGKKCFITFEIDALDREFTGNSKS